MCGVRLMSVCREDKREWSEMEENKEKRRERERTKKKFGPMF